MKTFKTFLTEDNWREDQWMVDNFKQLQQDEGGDKSAQQRNMRSSTGLKKDKLTIGHGANLEEPSTKKYMRMLGLNPNDYLNGKELSSDDADNLLRLQQGQAIHDLYTSMPDLKDSDVDPRALNVSTNLMYQLGLPNFNKFKNYKQAILNKDYDEAADELERGKNPNTKSSLYITSPNRVKREQDLLRSINRS
jgi:hypothetical protein